MTWLQMADGNLPSHLIDLTGSRFRYQWRATDGYLLITLLSGARVEIRFKDERQMTEFSSSLIALLRQGVNLIDARTEKLECQSVRFEAE